MVPVRSKARLPIAPSITVGSPRDRFHAPSPGEKTVEPGLLCSETEQESRGLFPPLGEWMPFVSTVIMISPASTSGREDRHLMIPLVRCGRSHQSGEEQEH